MLITKFIIIVCSLIISIINNSITVYANISNDTFTMHLDEMVNKKVNSKILTEQVHKENIEYKEMLNDFNYIEDKISKIISKHVKIEHIVKLPLITLLMFKTESDLKVICAVVKDLIFLGDFYDLNCNNITKQIAEKYNAQSILQIFNEAISNKQVIKPSLKTNYQLYDKIFNMLATSQFGTIVNNLAQDKIKLIVLSSDICYRCQKFRQNVLNHIKDIPFKIKIIPIDVRYLTEDKIIGNNILDYQISSNTQSIINSRNSELYNQIIYELLADNHQDPFYIWEDKNGNHRIDQLSFNEILKQMI